MWYPFQNKKTFSKITGIALIFIGCFCALLGCNSSSGVEVTPTYDFGTQSDSARYYFHEGWREIMDNGRWTESESNFRRAMDFDLQWPVGKSLVGRITRNLEERQQLLGELNAVKDELSTDEQLLLDIFIPGMAAMNNRDLGIQTPAEERKSRREASETYFRTFVHRHPDESYIKAEYIEVLHANHGAQLALDSLNALASPSQKSLPFFLSYTATLELELGHIEEAKALSDQLNSVITDKSYTSPFMLQAQILMAQDSLQEASALVNQVVQMDPNHLIALGMKGQIDKALGNE